MIPDPNEFSLGIFIYTSVLFGIKKNTHKDGSQKIQDMAVYGYLINFER